MWPRPRRMLLAPSFLPASRCLTSWFMSHFPFSVLLTCYAALVAEQTSEIFKHKWISKSKACVMSRGEEEVCPLTITQGRPRAAPRQVRRQSFVEIGSLFIYFQIFYLLQRERAREPGEGQRGQHTPAERGARCGSTPGP